MYLVESERKSSKWWMWAVVWGLALTGAFIATTLYLSSRPDAIGPYAPHTPLVRATKKKALLEMVTLDMTTPAAPTESVPSTSYRSRPTTEPTRAKTTTTPITTTRRPPTQPPLDDFRVPHVVLEQGPDPVQAEVPSRVGQTKKKSEAVFPAWANPDAMKDPVVIDPDNHFSESSYRLPGIGAKIPPFTYIRHHNDYVPEYSTQYPMEYEDIYDDEPEEDGSFANYLQKRAQDVYSIFNAGKKGLDWMDFVSSMNRTLSSGSFPSLAKKLREMYINATGGASKEDSKPILLNNTSSLVSFGLLAIDLFLLHNVQQIAFAEEDSLRKKMMEDPEVIALNSLFLAPDKIKKMSRDNADETEGVIEEVLDFVQAMVRAVINLGKAYKQTTSGVEARSNSPSPIDCIWTLYCRNLDKTAYLDGPYGLLAKMNSLGLRMMMGEFPVEQAIERLITEVTRGHGRINCQRLFPRCGVEEAKEVVLQTTMGDTRHLHLQ